MEKLIAYKGFNKDLTCRGFQYEVGKTYKHEGEVVRCAKGGFHSCENPLDIFGYYGPAESVFHTVEVAGHIDRDGDDTKIASAEITIKAEISIPEVVKKGVEWIISKATQGEKHSTEDRSHASNTGYRSAASNTGNCSAASNTGNYSAASNTGDYSAASNTGDYSAASNTGDYSAASNTGNYSAASNTGNYSAASNTGYRSAASNTGNCSAASNTGDYSAASNTGYRSAASNTGDYSAASNTGYRSAASNTGNYSAASNTGDYSAASVEGKHSVAMASGYQSKAKAAEGSAIVLVYRNDEGDLLHIRAAIAGKEVKADTWYKLDSDGEFIEVAA
ncbi:hypothetical protein CA267_001940 [Alteromonas pelagimontana]|uniref:DUF7666 domain-containing protein n=1 Tax=Alteromonas pelagimontana TaxID=1858656 RepID=A0A6M4MAP9_9ALTE|nr:hypothetical protein [Alteromonas pelagimontana]QJR79645.1 hypothetical protein CA267_001940 [Alteromonas pelagimontana]